MKNPCKYGAPLLGGAPIFLLALFFAAPAAGASLEVSGNSASARFDVKPGVQAAAANPGPRGTTLAAQSKVVVMADHLIYEEETGSLSAEGRVRIWYGDLTMTAQAAQADLETRTVHAQKDVVLVETGREIRCAEMDYDLKTGSANARGILFATHPWYYQGKSVEKVGEKQIFIDEPLFTTCNARRPHYHLSADRIDIVLGESLTAYNTVLYVGTTPLFYFPWVWRSINDHRPPFSIQVGYNSVEGLYAKTKYNYYFREGNYGSLLLDFMEKKGVGYGLNEKFRYDFLGRGEGEATGYYIRDKVTGVESTTARLNHHHDLDAADSLATSLEYVSYRDFNRDYSTVSVDTFQQKSYLSFSRRMNAYYLGVLIQDTETLDPYLNVYYPSQRQLPAVTYGLSPLALFGKPPVYFNLSSGFSRDYQRLPVSVPGTTVTGYAFRFQDTFNATPALTQTYNAPRRILTQPSLSASLSMPLSAYVKETTVPEYAGDQTQASARMDASYATAVTLTDKWVDYQKTKHTHLMQSRLTYAFSRKLAHLDDPNQAAAGVTGDNLGLGLDYYLGNEFSVQSSETYDFMDVSSVYGDNADWRLHLQPFSLSGRGQLAQKVNLNWQAQYQWPKGKITNGYFSAGTFGSGWNASWNTSYAFVEGAANASQVYSGLSTMFSLGPLLSLQSSAQYNFTEHHLNNISVSLNRDLHCWEMQVGYSHYFDSNGGRDEIGFSIFPKAFPQLKVGNSGASAGMSVGN
ncbi:MAG: LPS-assembly protein LptD [Candidatus Firestonebacteria bacterium]|nr:LPS-assembly protein LptD [Candidatus Firestonebacteria bacterium]